MRLFHIRDMLQKRDKILILCVIITSVILFIIIGFLQHNNGGKVCITINGMLYGEYSLTENQIITIDEPLGYNQIMIENGTVFMSEADCPDKYCMEYQPISKTNETIICLPHKLVVEVMGIVEKQSLDVIVQ